MEERRSNRWKTSKDGGDREIRGGCPLYLHVVSRTCPGLKTYAFAGGLSSPGVRSLALLSCLRSAARNMGFMRRGGGREAAGYERACRWKGKEGGVHFRRKNPTARKTYFTSFVPARHSRLPCRLLSSSTPCGVTTTKAGQESERYHGVRRKYTARESQTRLTDHVVSLRAPRVAQNRIDFFRCPSFRRNNTTTTAHLRFRQLERVGRHLHLLDALLQPLHVPSPPTPTSRWSQNSRRERTLTTVALD